MTHVCVVDAGYWRTKFKWSTGYLEFRSLVEKSENKLNKFNTWNVNFQKQDYLVGDGANGWNIELDKTNNELYKIAIYTGLSLIANNIPESFDVVVNYPLGLYNKENKEKFEQFIKGDFEEIEINGKKKIIRIRQCVVFPQTVPIIYLRKYEDTVGLIDIGGLTVQGCIVDKMNLVRDSIFSENKGCIIIYNEIKKRLNKKYGLNIQDYEIENIVKEGLVDKDLINEYLENWVFELKQIMRRNNWNIELLKIIYTGGGSLVLEKWLGELSNDPVRDNVNGLWEVGNVCYGQN